MTDLTFEYLNKLSVQIMTISSLLSGFSIAVVANLLVSDLKTRLNNNILRAAILAASFFLISLFAMTKVLMMTTQGYPKDVQLDDLILPRAFGVFAFYFGIISLLTMIGLAGWTKSKKMGIFSTVVGILTFILISILL